MHGRRTQPRVANLRQLARSRLNHLNEIGVLHHLDQHRRQHPVCDRNPVSVGHHRQHPLDDSAHVLAKHRGLLSWVDVERRGQ